MSFRTAHVLTGIRIPRMNAIMERWVQICRHELHDRNLIWNEHHLRHALHQFEQHHNTHRPHQAMNQPAPLRAAAKPLDPGQITRLDTASAESSTSTDMPLDLRR